LLSRAIDHPTPLFAGETRAARDNRPRGIVRDAADPGLSKAQRGRLVRALADRDHVGPDGRLVRVARATLDEWIRAYRRGGFEALVPAPRVVLPRTPAEVLELAFSLKRERPERTAAQVREIVLSSAEDRDRVLGCGRCRRTSPAPA
jgi:hypothetical protein